MKKDYRQWKSEKGKVKKNDYKKKDKEKSSVKIEENNFASEAKDGDGLFTSSLDTAHLVTMDNTMIEFLTVGHPFMLIHIENGSQTMTQDEEAKLDLEMALHETLLEQEMCKSKFRSDLTLL